MFSDPAHTFFSDADQEAMKRARDIINEAVIAELVSKDPNSSAAFSDSLRSHIIAFCQRLKADLFVIDQLMTKYNDLSGINKKNTK